MKFNKKWLTGLGLLVATVALAATSGDRLKSPVKIGDGTATTKSMIFDIGSGSSNPVIRSTNTGTLQFSNNGVDFSAFGAGGGGFGVDHISNPDFELNTAGYSAYQDAAGVAPVDATGGTPTLTITRTTTAGQILRGTASGKITKDAVNRQGEGVSIPFSIDDADKGLRQEIRFDYKALSGYVAGDLGVYVVDTTGPTVLVPNSVNIPAGSGSLILSFTTTTSSSYRLAFHVQSTSTAAWNMVIDNVHVGPGSTVSIPNHTAWLAYTPTYSQAIVDNAASKVQYSIDGTDILVELDLKFSSGGSGGSAFTWTMPPGYHLDPTIMPLGSGHIIGQCLLYRVGEGIFTGFLSWDGNVSNNTLVVSTTKGAGLFGGADALNSTLIHSNILSSSEISCTARVKAVELSPNIYAENTTVEYGCNTSVTNADDTSSFSNDPAGCVIPAIAAAGSSHVKTIRFKTAIQPSDDVVMQIQAPGDKAWVDIKDAIGAPTGVSGFKGAVLVVDNVDPMFQERIYFGGDGYTGGPGFSGDSPDWTSANAAGLRWRVRKSSNPLGLGFNNVGQNKSGLVEGAGQLKGTNTNDVALAGYVGEVIETLVTYPTSIPSGVCTTGYCDLGTIVLTAGDWQCSATETINSSSANTPTSYNGEFAISSCTGNCFSDFIPGANQIFWSSGTGGNPPLDVNRSITIPPFQVRSNGTTMSYLGQTVGTQNLHFKATFTTPVSGNYNVGGHLQCVRTR